MNKYLANSPESPSKVGFKLEVSSLDPRSFYVSRKSGGAVGAIVMHINVFRVSGGPDILLKARSPAELRFGKLVLRARSSVDPIAHASMELAREDFTKNLKFPPTSPKLRAGLMGPSSVGETKMRQFESGESGRLATVSRPGICELLAKLALRISSCCRRDADGMNELTRDATDLQLATELEYTSSSQSRKALDFTGEAIRDMRNRGGAVRCGAMSFVGRSAATVDGQTAEEQ